MTDMVQLDFEAAAADAAIHQAEINADEGWIDRARDAIRQTAHAFPRFTVDAVWDTGLPEPHEARAIGAIVRWAVREHLIVSTPEFVPSPRPGSHRCPRRVWASLVYEAD